MASKKKKLNKILKKKEKSKSRSISRSKSRCKKYRKYSCGGADPNCVFIKRKGCISKNRSKRVYGPIVPDDMIDKIFRK